MSFRLPFCASLARLLFPFSNSKWRLSLSILSSLSLQASSLRRKEGGEGRKKRSFSAGDTALSSSTVLPRTALQRKEGPSQPTPLRTTRTTTLMYEYTRSVLYTMYCREGGCLQSLMMEGGRRGMVVGGDDLLKDASSSTFIYFFAVCASFRQSLVAEYYYGT